MQVNACTPTTAKIKKSAWRTSSKNSEASLVPRTPLNGWWARSASAAFLKEQLVRLPNSTISQLMTDHIWSQMNLLGPESVIVEIASERLVEKREASLVCPECGSEFWRADE